MLERHVWNNIAATLGLAFLIIWFRNPSAFMNPQFMVDDGPAFFLANFEHGISALLLPHNGYLHVMPRLMAWFAGFFTLEMQPAAFVGMSSVLMAALVVYLLTSSLGWKHKELYALAIFLIPCRPFVYLHLTNTQWFAALFLLVAILQPVPKSGQRRFWDYTFVLLTSLSGPFCLIFLPLALYRIFRQGFNRYRSMITGLLSLGAGLQVLTFTIHSTIPSESGFVHFSLSQISRFASLLLFGRYAMPWLGLVALLILAVAAFFAFQGALSETRKDLIGIVLVGGVLALVTFYRMDAIIRNVHPFLMDTRYFLLPHILTAFFFLLAREGDRLARISATLVLALMLLSSASHFVEKPVRDYGWASYCDDMRAGKAVLVPIPWDGWQIAVNQK